MGHIKWTGMAASGSDFSRSWHAQRHTSCLSCCIPLRQLTETRSQSQKRVLDVSVHSNHFDPGVNEMTQDPERSTSRSASSSLRAAKAASLRRWRAAHSRLARAKEAHTAACMENSKKK